MIDFDKFRRPLGHDIVPFIQNRLVEFINWHSFILYFKSYKMGKIVIQFSVKKMSLSQYDQVIAELEEAGLGEIRERLYHVAAANGEGVNVTDVWSSEEAFNKFAETMIPALVNNGVEPAEPFILSVHNVIH